MGENKDFQIELDAEFDMELQPELVEAVVKTIGKPETTNTRYGTKAYIPVVCILPNGAEVSLRLWINPERGFLHPKSNAYKLLRKHGCVRISDLLGKKIELRVDNNGFYRFNI